VAEIPEAGRASRGKSVHQVLGLPRKAQVAAMLYAAEYPDDIFLVFATAEGSVKRTSLDQYGRPREGGIEAVVVKPGDRLVDVQVTDGTGDVVLATSAGRAIRFPEAEIPLMGRVSQGVRGVKLPASETLVGMVAMRREGDLCLVTDRGFAKRVPMDDLPVQGRGGMGSVVLPVVRGTGKVVSARELLPDEDLMAVTGVGRTVRVHGDQVVPGDLKTPPEPAVELSGHDRIVAVTRTAEPRVDPGAPDEEDAEDGDDADSPDVGFEGEGARGDGADEGPPDAGEVEAAAPSADGAGGDGPDLDLFGG
jgi:DNA gyrase subunit A